MVEVKEPYTYTARVDLRSTAPEPISEQLGAFRKALIAQGFEPSIADSMAFQLFTAYFTGNLANQGFAIENFR
jgi:hypothetical protein